MWVSFIIDGILLACGIWIVQRRKWHWALRSLIVFMLLLLLALAFYFEFGETYLGNDSWYNQTPWIHIIFFLLMSAGMAVRYITKAIEDRRETIKRLKHKVGEKKSDKPGLVLDRWELAYPFLFSVITFGSLWSQLDSKTITIANIVLCFQTGFLWQTILKRNSDS